MCLQVHKREAEVEALKVKVQQQQQEIKVIYKLNTFYVCAYFIPLKVTYFHGY